MVDPTCGHPLPAEPLEGLLVVSEVAVQDLHDVSGAERDVGGQVGLSHPPGAEERLPTMTSPTVTLRPIRDQDLPAVTEVTKQTLEEHVRSSGGDVHLVTEEFLRSTLDQSRVLVALAEGDVVGFLQYQVRPPNLIANGAALRPEWQRRGIGERLFARAVAEASKEECKQVVISVQPTNRSVYDLYLRLGFREGENPSGWNQELHMGMAEALDLLRQRGESRAKADSSAGEGGE